MSLYNMLNGVSPATFFILPMLGHHPDDFPRFRDCFTHDPEMKIENKIIVYTRTGGGNREGYEEENDWISTLEGYEEDYDDSFDPTFANWVFSPPEKWKADYELLTEGEYKLCDLSDDYKKEILRVYPKLEEKLRPAFYPEGGA